MISRETPTERVSPTDFHLKSLPGPSRLVSGCMEAKDTKQRGHLVGKPRASATLTKGSDPK